MNSPLRPSAAEIVTFVMTAFCAVLGLVVAPRHGGATWLILLVAALLAWQGVALRRRRIGPPEPAS